MPGKERWSERLRRRLRAGRRGHGGREPRTAFVLSGGGNLGAIQVGMMRALLEAGIKPDLILGCSVGALNGVALAQDPTLTGVARLEELWAALDGEELMPAGGWLPNVVALARRGEAVHDNHGLRRLLEATLAVETFEELEVPFQCVATDMESVREVWFSEGPLLDPILASSAIPAFYPGVDVDGTRYHDGAIVDDVPITRAVDLGATRLYVLQVGAFARPRQDPRRPLDVAIQAYWVARHHRFKCDLDALPDHIETLVLPTGQLGAFRYNDFTHSTELMASARDATRAFLADRAVDGASRTELDDESDEPVAEARDVHPTDRESVDAP